MKNAFAWIFGGITLCFSIIKKKCKTSLSSSGHSLNIIILLRRFASQMFLGGCRPLLVAVATAEPTAAAPLSGQAAALLRRT